MGFTPKMAKQALKKHEGNIELATEELIKNHGTVLDFADSSSESGILQA